ncbi:MAG: sigma-70 family RNA polymerase sigma factor [Deltaproteobacteria bacterium]|nr:sigma-70 family RNA polymerase sigma factor [Deltaproteobacteria bacterium]
MRTSEPGDRQVAIDPYAELAQRAAAGDEAAFEKIVRELGDRVRSVALRMLGDAFEADDLAQEVFFAVYRSLGQFRGEAKLTTWILRIARNHCLNRIKSRHRRSHGSERLQRAASALGVVPGVVDTPRGPESNAISNEIRQQVETAIAELPPKMRWLVVLRDVEGLSYEEIAEAADLNVGTVKSRLHRARERLADRLGWLVQRATVRNGT